MDDFYCDNCKKEFTARGRENGNRFGKWLFAYCSCGQRCIRYLTEKHLDPYFRKSRKLREMRDKYDKDLIQPDDPRFKIFYPEQYAKMEKDKEKIAEKEKKKKESRDKLWEKYPEKRSILKKIYDN